MRRLCWCHTVASFSEAGCGWSSAGMHPRRGRGCLQSKRASGSSKASHDGILHCRLAALCGCAVVRMVRSSLACICQRVLWVDGCAKRLATPARSSYRGSGHLKRLARVEMGRDGCCERCASRTGRADEQGEDGVTGRSRRTTPVPNWAALDC